VSSTQSTPTQVVPRLRVQDLSKTFPGQRALDGVSLDLQPGEVKGLLGANGSGKSTLIKILAGVYAPDSSSGGIEIDGEQLPLPVTQHAVLRSGLRFVHQNLGLVERRPVVENIALGRPFLRNRLGLIDWPAERRAAQRLMDEFEVKFRFDELVANLTRAEQALTAIMRAFDVTGEEMQILVLDEPTVGLPNHEVELVLDTVRRVCQRGIAVLFVSHSMDEVMAACHSVTVLRDGRVTLDSSTNAVTRDQVIEAITGLPPAQAARIPAAPPVIDEGQAALRVRGLRSLSVDSLDLDVRAGEIVGIAGELDSGSVEVLPALYGHFPASADRVEVHGAPVGRMSPRRCRKAGMTYVPADRQAESALTGLTVRENLVGGDTDAVQSGPLLRLARERSLAKELVKRYNVRPPLPERNFDQLSGGNQQKVVLARWMRLKPQVMLLQEPTQGVDVGARDEIAADILQTARLGAAILIITADLPWLVKVCSRVLVMHSGAVVVSLERESVTVAAVKRAIHYQEDPV
jgi:ribose transport system ATP-binding protein